MRRPFFVENITILGREQENKRSIRGKDLLFFLKNTINLGRKVGNLRMNSSEDL